MLTASMFIFLAASSSSKTTTSGSTAGSLIFFVVIFGLLFVMYRRFMRPRQRAAQAQRNTLLTLEPGDEVLTGAGIFGTVQEVQGERVTLWTGTGSTVTVLRRTIVRKIEENDPEYGTGYESDEHDEHEAWDDDDTAALEAHTGHDEDEEHEEHEENEENEEHDDVDVDVTDDKTHEIGTVSANGAAKNTPEGHLADRIEELTSPDKSPEDEDR
jgi:preprotein translocase subunit YajC